MIYPIFVAPVKTTTRLSYHLVAFGLYTLNILFSKPYISLKHCGQFELAKFSCVDLMLFGLHECDTGQQNRVTKLRNVISEINIAGGDTYEF